LLEAKLALAKGEWQLAKTKFDESISWAKKWHLALFTHEIAPQIQEQIEKFREVKSAQAQQLLNYLNQHLKEVN